MHKRFQLAFTAAFVVATCCMPQIGLSQVTPDGTLSTAVTSPDGLNFTINNGDRAGNNLYHSFRDFSVPTGGSAYFNNATDVQNIFSRVTGGNISNIDGLIRANGSANVFLLNPSGILFGPNASLNIGGAFVGTTADSIRFSDGVEFSASNPSATPLLTMSTPVGLQMGQNPGTITVQNTGHRLSFLINPFASSPDRSNNPAGLSVSSGNTLALVGGEIELEGGVLNAPSGHIELGSASNGTVNLNTSSPSWSFDYGNVQQFGDIQLSRQSLADASGSPAGSIHFQGQNISLNDASAALLINQGSGNAGDITVNASESLTLRGTGPAEFPQSLLRADNFGSGSGGNIVVSTPQLLLQDGGSLHGFNFGAGTGSNISVDAGDLIRLEGLSPISGFASSLNTNTSSSGQSGALRVNTSRLQILGGAVIGNSTSGTGLGGNTTINASDSVEISGEDPQNLADSVIVVGTFSQAKAGQLTINTPNLRVRDGGGIVASTVNSGSGGDLIINASNSVEVSGAGSISGLPSRIGARAELLAPPIRQLFGLPDVITGSTGQLVLNTPRLQVTDGAIVGVDHQGIGNAGDLHINADTVSLDRSGNILATTQSGEGGSINLVADAVTLRHGSSITAMAGGAGNGGRIAIAADTLNLFSNSQISTQAQGSGNAGTLNLRVGDLTLNQGQIEVENQGTGNAGRLAIQADSVQLSDRSLINASTQIGRGGDVQLRVRGALQLNGQSQILADAQQAGQGGNVSIAASNTVLRDRSQISTNAQGSAVGGALSIDGDRVSLSNGSQITASTTGTGRAGSLTLRANDGISLSGRNTRLAATSTTDAAAGSILLQTSDLQLDNHAAISVSGQGQGGAGNLTVRANTIQLNRKSTLSADVAGGNQGNINLQSNLLLLRRGSRISTNATGTASGGNIGIDTDFIVAVDDENSDITANATNSFGGRISIDATGIFGTQFRPQLTPFSDITASSGLGAAYSGTVSISNPDVDPGSDVVSLPEDVVDASDQVATGCGEYAHSRFIATGRGGIPNNPTEQGMSDRPWSDVRNISSSLSATPNSSNAAVPESVSTAQITEINSWVRTASGHVELVAVTPHEPTFTSATCAATGGH